MKKRKCEKKERRKVLNFSHKLKSEKQNILLVEAIKKIYICHLSNFLSDLFYLGIQNCLMFEIFTSNAKESDKQTKQGNLGICICTYTMHSFKATKWVCRTCFDFLLLLT